MRAVPHLCGFYPGICLTTEEKARQTSVRVAEAHYCQSSGIKIFNNSPLEIKNVAGDQKSPNSSKNFYTLIHFTQWKSTLVNCELCTVSQDFLL